MSIKDTIVRKLSDRFAPAFLDVIDDSDRHSGHAGWREGGETHFRVRIATRHFDGMTRVAQHRAIMETLDDELKSRVHALNIEVLPADGPYERPSRVR